MFEVRVEAEFAAAHFLQDYNGKCENLHGHNYKVYAHVKGSVLNEGGAVDLAGAGVVVVLAGVDVVPLPPADVPDPTLYVVPVASANF